jgi:SulP family sulfate permease
VATIGERFSYNPEGVEYPGIPPFLPTFTWPWLLPGPDGQPLAISFELFRQLLAPAFAIAMLGAIESLLCAVVADGMTGSKHDPNGELIGQGLGNLLAPLFGGITATAAIARSAANVRAGAFSPLAAIIHSGVVLVAILFLAPLFSYLPMAALAALLLMVAWNMSEVRHVQHTLRIAPRSDVLVLLTCLTLTVLFDMVLAVGVGLLLAAGLFIKRMSDLTDTESLPRNFHQALHDLPEHVLVYAIRGPLFFGAAEKALSVLRRFTPGVKVVIVDISAVPLLDMTALAALDNVLRDYRAQGVGLVLSGPVPHVRLQLRRAGIQRVEGHLAYVRDLAQAREKALRWLTPKAYNEYAHPNKPVRHSPNVASDTSANPSITTSARLKSSVRVTVLGTATTRMPAALADSTPASESSKTRQRSGRTPSFAAARVYTSGAGFGAATSSRVATTRK